MLSGNRTNQQRAFDLEKLVPDPQRQARGRERHRQPDQRQHGAVFPDQGNGIRPGRQAYAGDKYRQSEILQDLDRRTREGAQRRPSRIDPAEHQPA